VNILEYIKVEFFNCLIQSNLCTLQRRKFKLLVVFSAFLSNMTIGCWLCHSLSFSILERVRITSHNWRPWMSIKVAYLVFRWYRHILLFLLNETLPLRPWRFWPLEI
jgi:hypothetical protein